MLTYAIDFGTSNTLLGAADHTGPLGYAPLDPHSTDPNIIRSLIYFPNASRVYYGSQAIQEFIAHDHVGRLMRSIKRQLPVRSFIGTYVDQRPFNLENLIGIFLGEIRKRANLHFNQDVTRVVLGRPALFASDPADDRFAEERLLQAARLAGFKEISFFPEPVAAALGYEGQPSPEEHLIFAADYGGGTSDFTVYKMSQKSFKTTDVLAMGGISRAGDSLDAAIMRKRLSLHFGTGVQYQVPFGSNILSMPIHLMERICHPAEIALLRKQDTLEFFKNVQNWSVGPEDRTKLDRLFILLEDQLGFPFFEKIEQTKRQLSSQDAALFSFDYPGVEISESISRQEFESYAVKDLSAIVEAMDETLKRAQVQPHQIHRVLCTGGTAKVPWIRQSLVKRFGADKLYDLDPFRGVAHGLMQRAHELSA